MLMSDLRGFSELSERLGAPAMIGLLNEYLAKMTPVIIQHGGTINEFIGDGIFVLFGAPFGRPDDAERAVRCAFAMQEALSEFNAESRHRGLPELSMGIGLHVGSVVAGNIGSTERVKYGVVGPAVNLVARIQALTVGGEVLLSDAIRVLVASKIEVSQGRPERMKGVREPVMVYRLLAVANSPARKEADLIRNWPSRTAQATRKVEVLPEFQPFPTLPRLAFRVLLVRGMDIPGARSGELRFPGFMAAT